MTIPAQIISFVLCTGFAYWLGNIVLGLFAIWTMPLLAAVHPKEPPRWPRLSLVIPACNEAASLEAAVTSRLAQDYPDLEVCLVEDRSTDETPAIVDRLAQGDARVRVQHITALPEGWLGKVHALDNGVTMATGEWLLFTDADVHFAPGTLRRAIAYCEERNLDFLTVIPRFWQRGALIDALISNFVRLIAFTTNVAQIEDPRSSAAVGAGVFNLVRRSVYDRSPGLPWLRLEIADDVTFGQMIKRAGGRCSVVNARDMVMLAFYESLAEAARGTEKAGLPVLGGFSYVRLVIMALLILTLDLSPWIALLPVFAPWVRIAGAITAVIAVVGAGLINRRCGRAMWPSLLTPVACVISAAFMLRSGVAAWRRGGISWRGTVYSIDALRKGARMIMPWQRG